MVTVSPERISSPWFSCSKADPHARLRLFCFPYAGGGAGIYRGWKNYLPAGVEVCAIQPPGRGSRFREPAFERMESLVAAVANAIEPFLDLPIVLFGHSVGAMAGFELAHHLGSTLGVVPRHLFEMVSPQDLEAWKLQTTNSFDLWQLPGDHFFIHTADSQILQIVSRELSRLINLP